MWSCPCCNIEVLNTSKNQHLKSKRHKENFLLNPYTEIIACADDELIRNPLIVSSVLEKSEWVIKCVECGEDNKDNFYTNYKTRCKKCKYKTDKEKRMRKLK